MKKLCSACTLILLLAFVINARAGSISYTYDNLNRLTSAIYANGVTSKTVTYQYDATGDIISHAIVDTNANPLGTIVVNPNPNSLNASWALTGPNGYILAGSGDQTISDLIPGGYTITWGNVAEWVIPMPVTKTLLAGDSIFFPGTYQSIPVIPNPPTTGVLGGNITFNGSNFGATQGSGYVDFNGAHGIIVSWTDTRVVVKVPTGATSGCVRIVTNNGTSNCINFIVIADFLYADFGSYGLYKYDGATWTQITPYSPSAMAATGSLLYGTFGNGIWQYDGSTWSQLTPIARKQW